MRGKQKLLGIVPALAVGAYFYYKATKENEIEDDGYEEDIDDSSDDEDEVISTNKWFVNEVIIYHFSGFTNLWFLNSP